MKLLKKFIPVFIAIIALLGWHEYPLAQEQEYKCKLMINYNCNDFTSTCLSRIDGTTEWEEALNCVNMFKECVETGWEKCEELSGKRVQTSHSF